MVWIPLGSHSERHVLAASQTGQQRCAPWLAGSKLAAVGGKWRSASQPFPNALDLGRYVCTSYLGISSRYHGCCMSTLIWWRERTPNLCVIHTCNKSRDIPDPFLNSVAGFLRNKGAKDRLCLVVLRCCKGGMAPKYDRNLQWNMRFRFFRHNSRTWSDPICKLLTVLFKYKYDLCDQQTK